MAALNTTSDTPARRGWVAQPDQRGSIDIIWNCVSVLLICLWVMLHLNVPAKGEGFWLVFIRKSRYFFLAVLVPELLSVIAIGQWAAAKRSVADMTELGHHGWTMVHAFYAEMGGFVLHATDTPPFPVTAKQIKYLVQKGYMNVPVISEKDIWDKSKADKAIKTIAALQVSWVVIQMIARGIQRLPITLLELSTVGIIACAAITFFYWFQKPLDVSVPTVLTINTSIADVLIQAGDAARKPFRDSPLDFAENRKSISTLYSDLFHSRWGVQDRPVSRLPNDRDPWFHNFGIHLAVAIPFLAICGIQMAGWNFSLPTRAEQILYRASCSTYTGAIAFWGLMELSGHAFEHSERTWLGRMKSYKQRLPYSLLYWIPETLSCVARLCMIAEVLASMRSLPTGCFVNIEWTAFFPHIC